MVPAETSLTFSIFELCGAKTQNTIHAFGTDTEGVCVGDKGKSKMAYNGAPREKRRCDILTLTASHTAD